MKSTTAAHHAALATLAALEAAEANLPVVRARAKRVSEACCLYPVTGSEEWEWKWETLGFKVDAEAAVREAAAAAAAALFALPWGQRGCFFVADRAISWDGDRRRVLYRNGRPVMAAERHKDGEPCLCPLPEPRQAGPSRAGQAASAAMVRGALRRLPEEAQLVLIQLSWGRIGHWELFAGWSTTPAGNYSHPALPAGWEYREGQEGGAFKIMDAWHGAGRAITEICGPALCRAEALETTRALRRGFGDTSRL